MAAVAEDVFDRILACLPERVAQLAGILSAAVMAGEISLADPGAAARLLHRRGLLACDPGDADDTLDAARVAVRMIEDRARRATAFREPRR